MTLVLDFDGTIVDVRRRYHAVFQEVFGACGVELDDYWRAKRELVCDRAVCERLGVPWRGDAAPLKSELLEADEFLALDELIADPGLLARAFRERECAILTKRRDIGALRRELGMLGLSWLWEHCEAIDPAGRSKSAWVSVRRAQFPAAGNVVVGDSEEDMAVASLPGFEGWLVATGLRSAGYVRSLGYGFRGFPDLNAALAEVLEGRHVL